MASIERHLSLPGSADGDGIDAAAIILSAASPANRAKRPLRLTLSSPRAAFQEPLLGVQLGLYIRVAAACGKPRRCIRIRTHWVSEACDTT